MSQQAVLKAVEGRLASIVVDQVVVAAMAARLPAQTKEKVQEHLGISANTWAKIRKGEPARRSTAEILVKRILPHSPSGA